MRGGEAMSSTRLFKFIRATAITLGMAVGLAVLITQATAPRSVGGSGLSTAARDWCVSGGTSVPSTQVRQAGAVFLGMAAYSEDERPALLADPRWDPSCAIAYELWGLSTEEWEWCFRDDVQSSQLAPAITVLGMGEDEAAGTERFTEAPGDDPAEYTQACRFAYRFWRDAPSGADPGPPARAYFAIDTERQGWCQANPEAIAEARTMLGIGGDAIGGDALPDLVAETRACNFAALLADGRAVASAASAP